MIGTWMSERFSLRVFLPVAGLLALAATAGRFDLLRLAADTCAALLLLLQFRAWDDLADRRADAARHPQRALVRARSCTQLALLCATLGLVNMTVATVGEAPLLSSGILAALHAALGMWYLLRRRRTAPGDHLLLSKYPAFVCILAGERLLAAPVPVVAAAAAVYAAACVYEAVHDPVSPLAAYLGGRS